MIADLQATAAAAPGLEIPPSPEGHSEWRWIVVNSSGGKDSQTALRTVVEACDRHGISRTRIVVSHQCLGRLEWKGTRELAECQAAHYGLRFEVSRYRDKDGVELSLLDYVKKRRKWPSSTARFCTSEFKRSPGGRVIVKLGREAPGPILNVYGFRAEESPARKKKQAFVLNKRWSTRLRPVFDWLPIHGWGEGDVWRSIRSSGVPYHPAYDLGMPRLSCCFCIYAPRAALIIAGRANPELLDEYCALESEIDHSFQNGRRIAEIRDAVRAGEQPVSPDGDWNM